VHGASHYGFDVRPRLFVVFAAVCFSTTGTVQELGPDDAGPVSVAVMRTVIGALALLAFARNAPAPSVAVSRRHWWIAGAGMAGYAAAFFASVRLTGVAIGTVVALGSAPLFAGALGALLWRRAPDRRWLVTTAFAIGGVAMIVTQGGTGAADLSGIALAAVAGLSYAIFAISSKTIVGAQSSGARAMARVFVVAALLLLPAVLFVDLGWVLTPAGVSMALWLGVVTVAVAYWAYATGLRHLQPADTTALTLVEPVVATVLAATILGERPSMVAWIGIVVVIVSLALGNARDKGVPTIAVQH
jgi:DME family drug/metabolite transporter